MASRDLLVRVVGDESAYVRSLQRSTAETRKFDNAVTRSAGRVDAAFTKLDRVRTGAFLGGAAAAATIAGIKRVTDAASDLNEQVSKNRQVFGQSADEIEAWSKTTARSFGVSQKAALEATGTFGNLFDAIGIGGPQAAETSKRLVQLAADLASFNNADPSEVLAALRSGLIGEAEPLRRFGVLLSEARVQQVALAETGKTSAKALTDQEKALARVAIIFRDTGNAQGDFARTSESLANQQRILAANVADLEANLGRLLLPAITKITGALADATDAALLLTDALGKLGDVKIPPITIPGIDIKIPGTGDTVADTVADFLEDALDPRKVAARFNPAGNIALTLEKLGLIDGLFDEDEMRREIDQAAQDAIDEALSGFKFPQPKVDPAGFGRQPGVDFGHGALITGAIDDFIAGARTALDDATRRVQKGIDTEKAERALEKERDRIQKRLERQAELQKAAAERLQRTQFRALGLAPTGDELTPTVENLRKQLASLSDRLVGQDVPTKLTNRLAGVRKLLAGEFGKVTEETRSEINDLFSQIRDAFDQGSKDLSGPLTKTTAINTEKILDGLGLGRDAERELRARLSRFNSAGLALAGTGQSRTGDFAGGITSQPINITVVSELDGQVVARNTTKHQTKTGRGTKQKRGPNRRSGI